MMTETKVLYFIFLILSLAVQGCAIETTKMTDIPKNFINGTRVLAVATDGYKREEIIEEKVDKQFIAGWYKKLLEAGYKDADIVDGSEIGGFTYAYGHNSAVGAPHRGIYLAHIEPALQGHVHEDDIVEIELRTTPSNQLIGIVKRVFRKYDEWGDCYWHNLNYKGLFPDGPVGPPQGLWLDCKNIEKEGWRRECISGAPPTGPFGEKNTCVSEWRKMPPAN
jgi:hypothetical protein